MTELDLRDGAGDGLNTRSPIGDPRVDPSSSSLLDRLALWLADVSAEAACPQPTTKQTQEPPT